MNTKGVNKALAVANSVAKKSVKVFGNALPIMSVGANVLEAAKDYPGDPAGMLNRLVRNYSGFDPVTGTHSWQVMGKGLGSLLVTLGARYVINQVA